jgi:hypothetical protein
LAATSPWAASCCSLVSPAMDLWGAGGEARGGEGEKAAGVGQTLGSKNGALLFYLPAMPLLWWSWSSHWALLGLARMTGPRVQKYSTG